MNLVESMRLFVRVADARGFSPVARDLATSQSTVTRHVAALERHLGTKLVHRTTRQVALTEDGAVFYRHCQAVLEAVEAAENSVGARRALPAGLIRLRVPVAFGRRYIAPRVPDLLKRYPELEMELIFSDEDGDLSAQGIDAAIRPESTARQSVVAQRVGTMRRVLVASGGYLKRHGEPKQPADLARHNCIVFTQLPRSRDWTFRAAAAGPRGGSGNESRNESLTVRVSGNYKVNNAEALIEGVIDGIGIAVCPVWMIREAIRSRRVRRLLPAWEPLPAPLVAIFPSRRAITPKVRAVVDFFQEQFRTDPSLRGESASID